MNFDRDQMRAAAARLAREGVFVGASSWKYSGWLGQLYTNDRYVWRGRFSEARFERLCLAEYAEVFKTVCVDAAYYRFPDQQFLEQLVSRAPADFLFALKVTDRITLKRFADLPRFGRRAGTANGDFLNAGLFASAFLGPCRPFQANLGLLIFEFSRFSPASSSAGGSSSKPWINSWGSCPGAGATASRFGTGPFCTRSILRCWRATARPTYSTVGRTCCR